MVLLMAILAAIVPIMSVLGSPLKAGQIKPCCYPLQYESGVSNLLSQEQSGTEERMSVYHYGGVDLSNRQQGFVMSVSYPNGTTYTFRLIQKFVPETQWFILDEYKYCEKQKLQGTEPAKCVSEFPTSTVTSQIGGPNGTLIDTYIYAYPNGPGLYHGIATVEVVSGGSCIPVGSSFVGNQFIPPKWVPMAVTTSYINLTIGIQDPNKWFVPPSYCTNETNHVSRQRIPVEIRKLVNTFSTRRLF